jgi:hypothetical protein
MEWTLAASENVALPKTAAGFQLGADPSWAAAAAWTEDAPQAGSQLDAIYGPLQGRAIRDVTPAVLIMYGSHERELMESAAFWAGKATRSGQSYNHNSDDKTTQRSFGGALEPEELLPRNTGEARLVPRGTPGQMVELIDWDEFVCYLDELRQAR